MTYLHNTNTNSNSFLQIPNFPNYVISCDGKVIRNVVTGNVLSVTVNKTGSRCYMQCAIGHIHRLLKAALEGRPLRTDEYVRHQNGNTYDNNPSNLVIGTARQNTYDRIATNTNGIVLRNQDIRDIRHLSPRLSRKQLAKQYRISASHVGAILTRKRWANLP